jgi:ubiquinone/menaquinone biosynthesis C-methylase UbiE
MKIALCTPCRDKIEFSFMQCYLKVADYLRKQGHEVFYALSDMFPVDTARNDCVRKAALWGAEYYLWIDSDMSFQVEKLDKLFEYLETHENTIVSGLYFHKAPPFAPVIRKINDLGLFEQSWEIKDEPFEVDGVGFGLILAKRNEMAKIINRTKGKCFVYTVDEMSEDLYFCALANKEGIKIVVHPEADCVHHGGYVDVNSYINQKEKTGSGFSELANYLNKPMGFVMSKCMRGADLVANDWKALNPKTDSEILEFYKNNENYIYDLVMWWQRNRRQREDILSMIDKTKAKKILDYGCGIGDYGLACNERFNSTVAFYDINIHSLHYLAWRIGNRRSVGCSIVTSQKDMKMCYYDYIFCLDVLEHVKEPEKELEKIKALLKEDGILIAIVAPLQEGIPQHISQIDIEKYGFEKINDYMYRVKK